MSAELAALRALLDAYDNKPHHTGTRAWLDALKQARKIVAEADASAPIYNLEGLRIAARIKGYSVQGDARQGCFNVYDNAHGTYVQGRTAHAFCTCLREVAELLDTLPSLV